MDGEVGEEQGRTTAVDDPNETKYASASRHIQHEHQYKHALHHLLVNDDDDDDMLQGTAAR